MYSNVVWNDARYISLSMVKYNYHIKASQPIRKESYMAEKRKDDKKRNLFTGESQRKDGTYMYRYTDMFGKRHSVYAPTLNDLRIKEKQIQRDLDDGLSIKGGETTVGELLDIYLKTNKQWKPSTRVGKESRVKIIKEYPISTMRLNEVKQSHVQAFFIQLFDKGVKANSISVYKAVLRPAFQKAVDDDLIRKNPCSFSIDFLQKEENTKVALSQKEEKLFLEFVKQNKKLNWYYDIYVLMLETGLRLGETVGLTLSDIDLKNKCLSVNQQLCRKRKKGSRLYVDTLKTSSGKREIYISDKAYESLVNLLERRKIETNVEAFIDGYSNFLLASRKQSKIVTHEMIYRNLKLASQMYNNSHKQKIPELSPHILRHTFCTRMAEKGLDAKTLQYVMGHSDISTTFNIYTHWNGEKAREEMQKTLDISTKMAR